MEAKYYTPTIEEFHVGFEFEVYIISPVRNGKASLWIPFKIKDEEDFLECHNSMSLEGNLDANFCRVKCLDREDIESLEWEFIKLHPGTTTYDFELGVYYLTFDPEFGKYWNVRIYDGDDQDNEFNYFNGYIKNKTELKRIIHQIGISAKRQLEQLENI